MLLSRPNLSTSKNISIRTSITQIMKKIPNTTPIVIARLTMIIFTFIFYNSATYVVAAVNEATNMSSKADSSSKYNSPSVSRPTVPLPPPSTNTTPTSQPSVTSTSTNYTARECLEKVATVKVDHKIQPFGILRHTLVIEKNKCIFRLLHTQYSFIKTEWNIDVCRGPIHIKIVGSMLGNGVKVLKRSDDCQQYLNTEIARENGKIAGAGFFSNFTSSPATLYCIEMKKILDAIQDDGLIFANGEKEILSTDYGVANCSILLIKKYLEDGFIFGLHLFDKCKAGDINCQNSINNFYDQILFSTSDLTTPNSAPSSSVLSAEIPNLKEAPVSPTSLVIPSSSTTATYSSTTISNENKPSEKSSGKNKSTFSSWLDLLF